MVVDVRSCPVLLLLFLLAVVMAMCQRIVVMLMRMPVGAVLPLVERIVRVVMSHVIVVVCVDSSGMRVLRLASLSLCPLRHDLRLVCLHD
jgi:hypothetical protein